ncbi:MAG: penicillin-binding protein 2 [Betaproteobacteria bacterium]|jgi:cell division protein FtsI (penicillin-binding protein 3)|nr:penicillin-binding protein 2 [Betaproteobacteria bacterium]
MASRSRRNVPFSSNPLLRVTLPAYRSHLLMALVALAFLALAGRAVYLQVFSQDFLQRQGESRYARTLDLPASRGEIHDRNGVVLASSLPARAIFAVPGEVDVNHPRFGELARRLGLDESDLRQRISGTERTFIFLRRQLDPDDARQVLDLKVPGVHSQPEYKRRYPEGDRLAHIVGFTNVEDSGQEGIELAQNKLLAGRPGSRRVIRDRLGRVIEQVEAIREPLNGNNIALSIDAKVQYHVYSALRDAVAEHRAQAGGAVVLDIRTGEVLALVNLPTYDPNQRGELSGAQLRNRVLTDTFEPGSTMKPFTAALALELGKVTAQTVLPTYGGRITIGTHTLSDVKGHASMTVEQIIQKSSNVGTVQMALKMAPKDMWETFAAIGLGQAPQLGFPGAVAGRLRPHRNWKQIDQAVMSYGHGLSVSLMQLARAYLVFARDGDIIPVSIFKHEGEIQRTQVFTPETTLIVRRMLELAAGPGGTAPQAQVAGYRVAGKTGTAHKIENGRYVNKYVSSFVGFAPVSEPRFVVAVMIDEPSAGKHYGGQVAGPLFSRVMGETLRTLRVPPDVPGSGFADATAVTRGRM